LAIATNQPVRLCRDAGAYWFFAMSLVEWIKASGDSCE
jgi:hypothetical protein